MPINERAEAALLADQVYTSIRAAIMRGELPAGSRLRVRDLAQEVGTSVMPVREAIRRLEQAGLAKREPHRGAVVKGLTLEELIHVYDVRRLLEVEAARLGSRHISTEACEDMQREYERMGTAIADQQVVAYLDHEEALLLSLYRASGNPVLVEKIGELWQHCRAYKVLGAHAALNSRHDASLWQYQQRLVAAAQHHDDEAAAAVSAESLVDATDRIRAQLAERGAETAGSAQP